MSMNSLGTEVPFLIRVQPAVRRGEGCCQTCEQFWGGVLSMEPEDVADSSRRVRPPLTAILRSFFAAAAALLWKWSFLAHLLPERAATELTSLRSGLLKSDPPPLPDNFSVNGRCSSLSTLLSSSYFKLESKILDALPLVERGCVRITEA